MQLHFTNLDAMSSATTAIRNGTQKCSAVSGSPLFTTRKSNTINRIMMPE
jgi:hypothetical protein